MLRSRLKEAFKVAMKAKNAEEVSTLRLIMAALKDRDIMARAEGNRDGIEEGEILLMMKSMIKQRQESSALYEQGGRPELAQQEKREIRIIENFLPPQMSEEEIRVAVHKAVAEIKACGLKDMGKVMQALKKDYRDVMDFAMAGTMVREHLKAS